MKKIKKYRKCPAPILSIFAFFLKALKAFLKKPFDALKAFWFFEEFLKAFWRAFKGFFIAFWTPSKPFFLVLIPKYRITEWLCKFLPKYRYWKLEKKIPKYQIPNGIFGTAPTSE